MINAEKITAHVRLSGGATRSLVLDRLLPIAQIRKFKPELVAEVDRLLDQHCDREIAEILNQNGWRTWEAKPFNLKKIAWIRCAYKLSSRYDRLRRRGMLTTREVAAKFKISETSVHGWGRQGLITKCYRDAHPSPALPESKKTPTAFASPAPVSMPTRKRTGKTRKGSPQLTPEARVPETLESER